MNQDDLKRIAGNPSIPAAFRVEALRQLKRTEAQRSGVPAWTGVYVLSVVLVNWAFAVLPLIPTPLGPLSAGSFLIGAIFIVRDFAQREIGHRVLLATLAGIGISYAMASPQVATASAMAFAASELIDWAVFSVAKDRSFRQRVAMSHAVSVPVDTAVFLWGIGFLSPAGFLAQVLAKGAALAVLAVPASERAGGERP